jgi:carboxymethylenebutenolidase
MALTEYLATEVALDHVEGHLSRREALHKLGLLGLSAAAASTLLTACAAETAPPASAPTPAPSAAAPSAAAGPTAAPDYDVPAALARAQQIQFPGGAGALSGSFAQADNAKGAVLVIHENRGLTDHIKAVGGRLAGDGYTSLAPDLLSRAGGTGGVPDATAALGGISTPDLVTDIRSALDELKSRAAGVKLGMVGFCFGGGMTWQTLNSGPSDLAAAVPFYGPAPEAPTFTGSQAAVLGVFAEKDARVNAGKDKLEAALTAAGLTHELVTVPGVDHAFFNDTGPRYNDAAAAQIYQRVLAWFGTHLAG